MLSKERHQTATGPLRATKVMGRLATRVHSGFSKSRWKFWLAREVRLGSEQCTRCNHT